MLEEGLCPAVTSCHSAQIPLIQKHPVPRVCREAQPSHLPRVHSDGLGMLQDTPWAWLWPGGPCIVLGLLPLSALASSPCCSLINTLQPNLALVSASGNSKLGQFAKIRRYLTVNSSIIAFKNDNSMWPPRVRLPWAGEY